MAAVCMLRCEHTTAFQNRQVMVGIVKRRKWPFMQASYLYNSVQYSYTYDEDAMACQHRRKIVFLYRLACNTDILVPFVPGNISHPLLHIAQGSGANCCVLRLQPEMTTPAPRITTRLRRTTREKSDRRRRPLLDMLLRISILHTLHSRMLVQQACNLSMAWDTPCNHPSRLR